MDKSMPHIYFIGMPGSGKTTIGKILAKSLNYKFSDLDALIIKKENKTINNIFRDYGENYFRNIERKILMETFNKPYHVFATGGGIVEKNTDLLKNKFCIYLSIEIENIILRIKNKKNRPLLHSNLENKLNILYKRRKDLYSSTANITIKCDDKSISEINDEILSYLNEQ